MTIVNFLLSILWWTAIISLMILSVFILVIWTSDKIANWCAYQERKKHE